MIYPQNTESVICLSITNDKIYLYTKQTLFNLFYVFSFFLSLFSNNLWTEDEQNTEKSKQTNNKTGFIDIPNKELSGTQPSTASVDEETTTDWIPEIPFENVM